MGRVPYFYGGLHIWSWQPGTAGGKGDNIVGVATPLKLKKQSGTGENQTSGLCQGQDVREEDSRKPILVFQISHFIEERDKESSGYVSPVSQKCNWEPVSCWAGCCPEDRTLCGFLQRAESISSVSGQPVTNVSVCCGCAAIPPHLLETLYHSDV